MKLNLILAIALGGMILKIVMFILLCFGSLLWPLSIVAVIWGVYDGLLPAIQKKEFARAAVILLILLVTCLIIVISLQEAVYLTAFIVPILLVYIYINSYFTTGEEIFTDFSNN
jgi:asparagine N-glycosylation enzyme membrane subunit Stt3